MRFPKPLGVVCTTELGWRTVRLRWEKLLPLEFEDVRFVNPESFERKSKAFGSRSLREMLNTRAAAKAAIAAGAKDLLVATNTDATLLPRKSGARYFIYMDATHFQTQWISFRSPPKLRLKLRVEKMKKLVQEGHMFLCMSRFAAHGAAEEYGAKFERIRIVPPPVDTERFVPGPVHKNPPIRALFIGSRFKVKGGEVLLSLCKAPELSQVEWHFVTPETRPAPPNASFHQLKPDTDELIARIRSCDVLVAPTTSDMLSLAAIESQACGLAVVIRNIGGTSEVVVDGGSGYVIDRSDQSAVKEALLRYVADPSLLSLHGQAGRESALKRYSFPIHAAQIRSAVEAVQ